MAVALNVLFPTALFSAAGASWSPPAHPRPPRPATGPLLDSVQLLNAATTSIKTGDGGGVILPLQAVRHSLPGCNAGPAR